MAPDSEHNPDSPPQTMDPAAISEGRQLVPSWWRWTIVTILAIVLINIAFLSTGRLMTMGYPVGQGIAFCCGVFVLGIAVLAGRRFTLLRALGLG